jgi:hypothetical protein
MKKLIFGTTLFFMSFLAYSQQPEVGHLEQLSTVKRGDTLDVKWYYKPAAGTDIRAFQLDWQYKKTLLTHISTTVDNGVSGNSPVVDIKTWSDYKYGPGANVNHTYVSNPDWSIGRNYLILPNGSPVTSNGYIIHNKYKVNNVESNYVSDTITVNWAKLYKIDGTAQGEDLTTLNRRKMVIKLLGNLTISGKIYLPPTVVSLGYIPTIKCYNQATNVLVSTTTPNTSTGLYTLRNIDENTNYRVEVVFPTASLASLRDNAVTITDAVKTYNEYIGTDVNSTFSRNYLKSGLSYLTADLNFSLGLDGGDPYSIYASVSGLRPINTSNLINVFKQSEYDNLVLGTNQWTTWSEYTNRGISVTQSVGTTNATLDLKYFILGDVDRSHSSPVFDTNGVEQIAATYNGTFNVTVPNSFSVGQPISVPFNINTDGLVNGLQFEMTYDKTKVKFDEIILNIQGPWLQYVTNDPDIGVIRFGGMNNQNTGSLQGVTTPFLIKFSPLFNTVETSSFVKLRTLMDATDKYGNHFNITLNTNITTITYRPSSGNTVKPVIELIANLFPNPTNSEFGLEFTIPYNTMVNVSIYDMTGKQLMNLGDYKSNNLENKFYKKFDVSHLSQGIYLVSLGDNHNRTTKQLIKI